MTGRLETPVVAMSSGGKDSLYMVHKLSRQQGRRIAALLTRVDEENGRVPFHGASRPLLQAQADALGLDLYTLDLPSGCSNRMYEKRLEQALKPFLDKGIDVLACGDLHVVEGRQWREKSMAGMGWRAVFPIWKTPLSGMLDVLENEGWGATVCCVDLTVLPEDFLGRNYDRAFVNDLPPGVDPFGENGEFHTFVHTAPGFSARVGLATGQRRLTHSGQFLTLELNPA